MAKTNTATDSTIEFKFNFDKALEQAFESAYDLMDKFDIDRESAPKKSGFYTEVMRYLSVAENALGVPENKSIQYEIPERGDAIFNIKNKQGDETKFAVKDKDRQHYFEDGIVVIDDKKIERNYYYRSLKSDDLTISQNSLYILEKGLFEKITFPNDFPAGISCFGNMEVKNLFIKGNIGCYTEASINPGGTLKIGALHVDTERSYDERMLGYDEDVFYIKAASHGAHVTIGTIEVCNKSTLELRFSAITAINIGEISSSKNRVKEQRDRNPRLSVNGADYVFLGGDTANDFDLVLNARHIGIGKLPDYPEKDKSIINFGCANYYGCVPPKTSKVQIENAYFSVETIPYTLKGVTKGEAKGNEPITLEKFREYTGMPTKSGEQPTTPNPPVKLTYAASVVGKPCEPLPPNSTLEGQKGIAPFITMVTEPVREV